MPQGVFILAFVIGSQFSIVAINEWVFDIKAHENVFGLQSTKFSVHGHKKSYKCF